VSAGCTRRSATACALGVSAARAGARRCVTACAVGAGAARAGV
jgi:hypothetical protein